MIQNAKEQLKEAPPEKPFKSELWNYCLNCSHDFESFLTNCTQEIFDLGCYKSFAYKQLDYLTNEQGNLAVNFVGRFETLQEDFSRICKHISLPDCKLPILNQTERTSHYRDYYSNETQTLIAKRFKQDIEMFSYSF